MNRLKYISIKIACVLQLLIVITSCHSKKIADSSDVGNNTKIKFNVEVANNERGVLFRRFAGGVDTSKVYLPGK